MFKKIFSKLIFLIQLIFVSLYIFLEELVWERFAEPIFKYIKHLRLFKRLEIILNSTNRYVVLILFLLSFVFGELFGVLSPIVALKGYALLGISLYGLKLVIVAFAFWLFKIQKHKLLSFWLIKYSYEQIIKLTYLIKNSYAFKSIKATIIKIKIYIKKIYLNFKDKLNF